MIKHRIEQHNSRYEASSDIVVAELQARMDEMAANGWELVSITTYDGRYGRGFYAAYRMEVSDEP